MNVMRNSGCEVPEWMLALPAPSQKEKKQLRRKPVDRKDVSATVGSIGGGSGSKRSKRKQAELKNAKASSRKKDRAVAGAATENSDASA